MLLVRAGEMFHRSLDVSDTLNNVARMAVESFAELCLFDLLDEYSDRLYVTAGAHRDASLEPALKAVGSSMLYNTEFGLHPAVQVTQTGRSFFIPVVDEAAILSHAASLEHAAFMRRMGYRSKIVVPVAAQGHIFGALTFVRTGTSEPFDIQDVQAAEELARRAGLAIANAKQYHREQHVAGTLQRAFLSLDFPVRNGLEFHALYRPGKGDAELGGDWFDAFETRDGSIVLTIGDVTGKGIEAARLMVQLRQSVRIAATISRDPVEMLRIINDALLIERSDATATAFVGVVDRETTQLHYASAGHPPAFVRWNDGRTDLLAASSPPLGISSEIAFDAHTLPLANGGLLVLYTDGITEITRDALVGEATLRRVLESEAIVHAANPARYVERAVAGVQQRDDIAIMTMRFGSNGHDWRFDVGDSSAAYAIKRDLLAFLDGLGEPTARERHAFELVLSELIGNSVRHAPGPLSLSVSAEEGAATLHIIDEGEGFDFQPALPRDLWSESGRGLFLISQLAADVRVTRLPGYGSYIRATLPVRPRVSR